MQRIVLAYSGGLDTSVAIPWLAEKYGAEIIAVTVDLGQGHELRMCGSGRSRIGALRAHVVDARDEFARHYILPALQAGAVYEDRYPLATALGRPLIAKHLVEIARMEGASAIAHGCTGEGQRPGRTRRFGTRAGSRHPGDRAGARLGHDAHRRDRYARARNIEVPATLANPYSTDSNLWGRSIECGVLEDPWQRAARRHLHADPSAARLSRRTRLRRDRIRCRRAGPHQRHRHAAARADREPRNDCRHARRRPHRHGREPPGRHQVAGDLRSSGRRRAARRAPGAREPGHRARSRIGIKHDMARLYADAVYNGLWFSQTREAIDAFVASIQPRVTGVVRLKLFKGDCRVVGRKSPFALYDHGLATYDAAIGTITAPPKVSSRSGGFPSKRLPANPLRGGQRRSAEWRTSGPAGSKAIPTPHCSSSAPRSDSIGGCSRTM